MGNTSEEIKSEVEQMNKILLEGSGEPEPKSDATDPKPSEKAGEDKPPEPEPEDKEGDKAAATTTEEVTTTAEPKEETPPTPPPDNKDELITQLQAQLAELQGQVAELKKPKEPEKVKEPDKPEEIAEQDFVAGADIQELAENPKEFNGMLNKIYQKAMIDSRTQLMEALPTIVSTHVANLTRLKDMGEKFLADNEDLKPHRKVVTAVFDELVKSKAGATLDEVLSEVAVESRKRLKLPNPVKKSKDTHPTLPKVGGKAGSSTSKPTTSPLKTDIEEMNKSLGR